MAEGKGTLVEALTEAGYGSDEEEDEQVETSAEAENNSAEQPEAETDNLTEVAAEETTGTDGEWPEDVPESYFGQQLKGKVTPEAAKELYEYLVSQDRAVNARLREISEARKQAEEEPQHPTRGKHVETEEPSEEAPSVKEQLAALGADPDLIEEVGLMPLASKLLELDSSFQAAQQSAQAQEWENNFHRQLDKLESEYGPLPYERDSVVEYAIDQDIYSPKALYWDIAGPLREQTRTEMAKRLKASEAHVKTAKKAVRGTPRRASARGATALPSKPKTMAEAYEMTRRLAQQ